MQTVDADNRLVTFNGNTVSFDANGNLLSIAGGVSPAAYTYDARNRLISAGGVSYTYNSENRRTSVTDSTGTTQFAINPVASLDQVLVKTGPGGVQTFYVYGLGLINEETNGAPIYYHFDRLGNTVALTNNTSAVIGQISYGPHGEISSRSGITNTPFLFNGRWGVQTDSNGLNFHRARYYHPQLRRFLNQDTVLGSIGVSASMNRFAYANGNPVSSIDPFGTMAEDVAPNSATTGGSGFPTVTSEAFIKDKYIMWVGPFAGDNHGFTDSPDGIANSRYTLTAQNGQVFGLQNQTHLWGGTFGWAGTPVYGGTETETAPGVYSVSMYIIARDPYGFGVAPAVSNSVYFTVDTNTGTVDGTVRYSSYPSLQVFVNGTPVFQHDQSIILGSLTMGTGQVHVTLPPPATSAPSPNP